MSMHMRQASAQIGRLFAISPALERIEVVDSSANRCALEAIPTRACTVCDDRSTSQDEGFKRRLKDRLIIIRDGQKLQRVALRIQKGPCLLQGACLNRDSVFKTCVVSLEEKGQGMLWRGRRYRELEDVNVG